MMDSVISFLKKRGLALALPRITPNATPRLTALASFRQKPLALPRLTALALLCLALLFLLPGCATKTGMNASQNDAQVKQTGAQTIHLRGNAETGTDNAGGIGEAVSALFPGLETIYGAHITESLGAGAVIEVYDAQVQSAVSEKNRYWLPLALETVVIAVDRSKVNAEISSWSDLLTGGAVVSISDHDPYYRLLVAALCYGLEGEDFTMGAAAVLLEKLHRDSKLRFNDEAAPILICFDAEAAKMRADNPAVEIIIPSDGTLSYARGLLSASPLGLPGDADAILLGLGLRLSDGRCENSLYPDAASYAPSKLLTGYSHLNTVMQDTDRVVRREVRHTRLYTGADGLENTIFALVYIAGAVFWIGAITRRTLRGDVRRIMFIAGIMLVAWMTLRIMKFMLSEESAVTRYAWYMYYFFQLALPLVMLRITLLAGSAEEKPRVPLPYQCACGVNAAMFLLVITNDLHEWVFIIDLAEKAWTSDAYAYGTVYFFIIGVIYAQLAAAVMMLFIKAKDNPRRMGFVLPLIFVAALSVYSVGYAAGIPFFAESDMTMVIGVFALLFLELCIRAGQLPVNTDYRKFFRSTANKLQVVDLNGAVVLSGDNVQPVRADEWESLKKSGVIGIDDNTLLYLKGIIGGFAVWQVDVTAINALKKQIEAANRQLAAANDLLEKEEQIKGQAAETRVRTELFAALEKDLGRHQQRLAGMLADLPDDEAGRKERIAAITLLLCFTKRKCQLLFMDMSGQEAVSPGEFISYMNTLADIARINGTDCLMCCNPRGDITVHQATLFYDFFVSALECTITKRLEKALVNMLSENGSTVLKILMPPEALPFEMDEDMQRLIEAEKGVLTVTGLEEMAGLSLSFPERGEAHA